MKSAMLLLVIIFLIVGCEPGVQDIPQNQESVHMGCAPEDTKVDGMCDLNNEENNAGIFGSLDQSSLDISTVEGLGLLVKPKAWGTYPGVVMIHEWWGLNDNIKQMAKHLASQGYVVLAVDLYDGKVAETQEQASALTGAVRDNQEKATETLKDAVLYLRDLPEVSNQKIGSMGWCFGGGQSLQLALSGEPMDATVIYYGQLTSNKTELKKIQWPVLGIFGAEDTGIPVDSVNAFESALTDLKIENEIHIYPGVGHAFANPSGSRFAPNETKDAWDKTLIFLDENLK